MRPRVLFKRLYNWVKYKTLPPSILYKNRLFIERDSKNRRVFSNFGLTFRSSKWSNRSVRNLVSKFTDSYIGAFIIIFCGLYIFTLFLDLVSLYLETYHYYDLNFVFWTCADVIEYYLCYWFWIIGCSFITVCNLVYSYFFFNNFSKKFSIDDVYTSRFSSKKKISSFDELSSQQVSKHDLNWVLYVWLTRTSFARNALVEKIFNETRNTARWAEIHNLFVKLYKVSFFFTLTEKTTNASSVLTLANQLRSILGPSDFKSYPCFNNVLTAGPFMSLYLIHQLDAQPAQYFEYSNDLPFLTNRTNWNLYNLSDESQKFTFLFKTKTGLFYLNNFSQETVNNSLFKFPESWAVSFFLKYQTVAAKWKRWLYKYSTLHRKVLKASHKLTTSKRLVNSGFSGNSFFGRNLWNSENFSSNTVDTSMFSTFFDNYYKNFYKQPNRSAPLFREIALNSNFNQTDRIFALKNYENSFFFFLKRFFFYNTLNANNVVSAKVLQTSGNFPETLSFTEESLNKHFYFLSALTRSNLFSYSPVSSSLPLKPIGAITPLSVEFSPLRDLFVTTDENDLFSKSSLNVLSYVTASSADQQNLRFFSYLGFQQRAYAKKNTFAVNDELRNAACSELNKISLTLNVMNDLYLEDLKVLYSYLD